MKASRKNFISCVCWCPYFALFIVEAKKSGDCTIMSTILLQQFIKKGREKCGSKVVSIALISVQFFLTSVGKKEGILRTTGKKSAIFF